MKALFLVLLAIASVSILLVSLLAPEQPLHRSRTQSLNAHTVVSSTLGSGDHRHPKKVGHQSHLPPVLGMDAVREVRDMTDMVQFHGDLQEIMIPRTVGSLGHTRVRQFLIARLSKLGFHVHVDRFRERTPHGEREFANVVATYGGHERHAYLMMAAHYDSKILAGAPDFVAATDSAVSCAMLLDLAAAAAALKLQPHSRGLLLVFFDGEEAFERWTNSDSIYGARHLAQQWHENDKLARISVMVLLDLIGSSSPAFYSHFANTQRHFRRLQSIHRRLQRLKLARVQRADWFKEGRAPFPSADDHVPFVQRGVPVVHLIVTPYPRFWHTAADDKSVLDQDVIQDLLAVFRVWMVEFCQMGM